MALMRVVEPLAYTIAGTTGFQGAAFVATESPLEAAYSPDGGTRPIDLDFGANVSIDTIFVGYTNFAVGSSVVVQYGVDGGGPADTTLGTYHPCTGPADGGRHLLVALNAPITLRYLRIYQDTMPAGTFVGIVAAGLAIKPIYGREYGSGRCLTDLSNTNRQIDGTFSTDRGVVAGGFQWSHGDLTNTEVIALYRMAKRVGQSISVLVCEETDAVDDLNESLHWGRLKLDIPERYAPGYSKWAFRIDDWR